MFVRTGINDYELAVVITSPETKDDTIGVIAIGSILNLQHTGKEITMNPATDFINGYDAGRVDVTPDDKRRLARWVNAGMIITLKTTAAGKIRFGRVPFRKLGLTEAQDFWLKAWAETMDYETSKRQTARAQAAPEPKRVVEKKPKMKRKDIRRADRRRDVGVMTYDR